MANWTATKRDANGRVITTPMGKDPRGNYRPLAPVQQSACRQCGRPNYSAEYSTCSRCG